MNIPFLSGAGRSALTHALASTLSFLHVRIRRLAGFISPFDADVMPESRTADRMTKAEWHETRNAALHAIDGLEAFLRATEAMEPGRPTSRK